MCIIIARIDTIKSAKIQIFNGVRSVYSFTIELKSGGKTPLYKQLYEHIAEEIRQNKLEENERMPSKKSLASHLGISANTVETAYEILVQEGYLEAVPRSGFYVRHIGAPPHTDDAPNYDEEAEQNSAEPQFKSDFRTAAVDVGSFPYATWIKLSKEVMYGSPELLNAGRFKGDIELRRGIAKYLREFRGVNCSPVRVIVGAGIEFLLTLICELLGKNCSFAIEDPGYEKIDLILRNGRRKVSYVPLDKKGMSVSELEKSGADIAYITPSHQFPTGIVMPIDRRAELLRWADEKPERYIIEDDISGEFNYTKRPMTAVQGISGSDKVIYLNTFSRVLAPSIRIAYMVLPEKLLKRFEERFSMYASTVPRFEQRTLSRFIAENYLSRHLNRVKNIYRKRRDLLIAVLKSTKYPLEISGERAGVHIMLKSPAADMIIKKAAESGIKLYRLDDYFFTPVQTPSNTLVAGYAGVSAEDIENLRRALT